LLQVSQYLLQCLAGRIVNDGRIPRQHFV
jgi:hypothetical protein